MNIFQKSIALLAVAAPLTFAGSPAMALLGGDSGAKAQATANNTSKNQNTLTGGDNTNTNTQGQAQGIFGSGNSENTNENKNVNLLGQGQGQQQGIDSDISNENKNLQGQAQGQSLTNTNDLSNENKNLQGQAQGQGQGQGQRQGQGQGQSQSGFNAQGQGQSANNRQRQSTSSSSTATNAGNNQTVNFNQAPEATVAPMAPTSAPGQVGDVIVPLPSIGVSGFGSRDENTFGYNSQRNTFGVQAGFSIPLGTGQVRRAAEQVIARREASSRFQLIQEATWMMERGVLSQEVHPEHWAALFGTSLEVAPFEAE